MWPGYLMAERQLSTPAVNRQLPIGRVDGVDGIYLMQVDKVDGEVDADGNVTIYRHRQRWRSLPPPYPVSTNIGQLYLQLRPNIRDNDRRHFALFMLEDSDSKADSDADA